MAHGRSADYPRWLVPQPLVAVLCLIPVVAAVYTLLDDGAFVLSHHMMMPLLLVAIVLAARWPRYALMLVVPLLLSPLWGDQSGSNYLALLVLIPVAMTAGNQLVTVFAFVIYLGWTIIRAAVTSLRDDLAVSASASFAAVGMALGLAGRHLASSWHRSEREVVDLAARTARARAEQRTELAREMHDGVAHQIKMIAHAAQTGLDGADDDLPAVLSIVEGRSRSALNELRVLLGVLRDGDAARVRELVTEELSERHLPSVVASNSAGVLREAGHPLTISVDPGVDELPPDLRQTVCRLLQEGVANVLTHGVPGAACELSVAVDAERVHVLVTNEHPGPVAPRRDGWGLTGLRECVQLSGGSLRAGLVDQSWQLVADMPLRVDGEAASDARAERSQ
ncbi:sensor histidine kinase [Aestuariimicrobium ganziense]|uniref:sensor histidine kinase n=1 Tax=Aestuariimicrobium ganziense TaxID=2773677 RepID=UPI001940FCA9|nr:histidine kinase [Aestuariimicrobium ganziense]